MSDILTQLQDALDILVQQMYAGLMYTHTRHPNGDIPRQPYRADLDSSFSDSAPASDDRPHSPPPDPNFTATQHEIANDIVVNMARINALVDRLPGIGFSEQQQLARLAELDNELRAEMENLDRAKAEKKRLLALLNQRITQVRRP